MSLFIHEPKACRRGKQETLIEVRLERRSDTAARERLLDAAFGASRFAKTSERLREGRMPARAAWRSSPLRAADLSAPSGCGLS